MRGALSARPGEPEARTIGALAKQVGVGDRVIREVFNGHRDAPLPLLFALAAQFGQDVAIDFKAKPPAGGDDQP